MKIFSIFSIMAFLFFTAGKLGYFTGYAIDAEESGALKAPLLSFPPNAAKSDGSGEKTESSPTKGNETDKRTDVGDTCLDESVPSSAKEPIVGADSPDKYDAADRAGQALTGQDAGKTVEAESSEDMIVQGKLEKGDTVGKILEKNSDQDTQSYLSATGQIFSLRSFRAGQSYKIITDSATGRLKRFEYEIDSGRRLVVEGLENPVARLEAIEYITTLAVVEAVIDDNLFQAVADIGESPQLALRLADIFGSEINFIRDLQKGDSFTVLLEKRQREEIYAGYGRILAARFVNKGKIFEAFLFRDAGSGPQHYNRKGENLRKTLLQAPLAFTRVTSRFSQSRLHPVLGETRPHFGVDYAAPMGTPVKAVGDGVVMSKGWAGGFGNQIIVKHSAGLESLYAHLSGYARGTSPGGKVRQGQVIAFVGSTGLVTGPHLDFRLRQNGRFIDPLKAVNPRGEPVSARNRQEFEKIILREQALLNGEKMPDSYTVNSIVPEYIVLDTSRPEKVEKKKTPFAEKKSKGQAKRKKRSAD